MATVINELLKLMVERKASDLHITANLSPHLRIDEKLVPLEYEAFTPQATKELCYSILDKFQIDKFEQNKEFDFAFEVKGLSRFRVNIFLQRKNVGMAIRALPYKIMTFQECGLPVDIVNDLCCRPKGLVLVTGSTGSGKSTTLTSMIDKINSERPCHIISVEDPIEFVHENKKAIVDQRELGDDTHSFSGALKHVLRQDPDVILIGEMRDLETIEAALMIAETGHLVFGTLHTSDSVQTINRIVDVFPAHQQQQVRTQLSFVLIAVLAQQLIPKTGGKGRVLATEILISNYAMRSLIREEKVHQIYSLIQTSKKDGMKTMNQSLYELHSQKLISYEDAVGRTTEPQDLLRLFKKNC